MSILKNDTKVNRVAKESGVMFDADDHANMALITTKQFGARIGMVEDDVSRGDEDKELTEGNKAYRLQ